MKLITPFIAALVLPAMIYAQQATLSYDDINAGDTSSYPRYMTEFKGKVYFVADDGKHGSELWSLDSFGKVSMVADINPGPAGMEFDNRGGNSRFVIADSKFGRDGRIEPALFFIADNGFSGNELYQYDGATPPVLVHEFAPGKQGIVKYSLQNSIKEMNGKIYIYDNAIKGIHEFDPLNGNARKLKGPVLSYCQEMEIFDGKLFMNMHGSKLFYYDPGVDSILSFEYINAPTLWSTNIHPIDGKLYYYNFDKPILLANGNSVNPTELYEYDGVPPPVKLCDAGYNNKSQQNTNTIAKYKGKLYFTGINAAGYRNLYRYDPVTKTSSLFAEICKNCNSMPRDFMEINDTLYFFAYYADDKVALYETDGNTVTQTIDLSATAPVIASTNRKTACFPIFYAGSLYFSLNRTNIDYELFRYGSPALKIQDTKFATGVVLYPNPSNHECHIEFQMKQPGFVDIRITDITGKEVYTIADKSYPAGKSSVQIYTGNFAAGTYIYSLNGTDGMLLYSGRFVKE